MRACRRRPPLLPRSFFLSCQSGRRQAGRQAGSARAAHVVQRVRLQAEAGLRLRLHHRRAAERARARPHRKVLSLSGGVCRLCRVLGGGQAQAPSWRGRSPRRAVRVRPLLALAARSLTWRNRRSLAAPRPSFNLWNWKRDATTIRRLR